MKLVPNTHFLAERTPGCQALSANRRGPTFQIRPNAVGGWVQKAGRRYKRTPARVAAGAGQLLDGPRAPAVAQASAGTMAEVSTGTSSQPSMFWFTRTNTLVPTAGLP